MVQWCSRRHWWFPSVYEMSQPSWGGGPTGSPPHSRMTSSSQPLMQLHRFDDIDRSRLQHLLDCIYQSDFQSPFLFTGASGLFSYLMYSDSIVQSPGWYPRHNMYVGFIIMLFIWLMFMPTYPLLLRSVVFQAPYCLYYFLGGHRYASPAAYSRYSLIKETCCTCKLPPQGLVLSALWFTLYFSLFDFPFDV